MTVNIGYFESAFPAYSSQGRVLDRTSDVFRPILARGGLGEDALIGHAGGNAYSVIDLSSVELFLTLDVFGFGAGIVTDGIDSIVFQGVETIIFPSAMKDAIAPKLQEYRDQGLHVCLAEDESAALLSLPAE